MRRTVLDTAHISFRRKHRWYINPLFVFLRVLSQTGSFVLLSHDEHRGVERAKQRRAGHFVVIRRRVSLFGIRSWCGFVVIALVLGFFDSRLRLRGGLRDDAVDAVV